MSQAIARRVRFATPGSLARLALLCLALAHLLIAATPAECANGRIAEIRRKLDLSEDPKDTTLREYVPINHGNFTDKAIVGQRIQLSVAFLDSKGKEQTLSGTDYFWLHDGTRTERVWESTGWTSWSVPRAKMAGPPNPEEQYQNFYWLTGGSLYGNWQMEIAVLLTINKGTPTEQMLGNVAHIALFRPHLDEMAAVSRPIELDPPQGQNVSMWMAGKAPRQEEKEKPVLTSKVTAPWTVYPGYLNGQGKVGLVQRLDFTTRRYRDKKALRQWSSHGDSVLDQDVPPTSPNLDICSPFYDTPIPILAGWYETLNLVDYPRTVCRLRDEDHVENTPWMYLVNLMYRPAGYRSIWVNVGKCLWSSRSEATYEAKDSTWKVSGHLAASVPGNGFEHHFWPEWTDWTQRIFSSKAEDLTGVKK